VKFPKSEPKGKPFQWKAKEPKQLDKTENLEQGSKEDSEGDGLMSEGDIMFPTEDSEG
jgi:hypothetical protein